MGLLARLRNVRNDEPMRYPNEIEHLTQAIQQDESRYVASRLIENQIIATIAEGEFASAIQRTRQLANQQALAERIRRNKIMLAWAQL
ncbi:hypothetical protein [Terriglobus sp. TAA 43]|uniref:hypothetical protein n=1 Tax=Terriglobus sp. TAA 43 TaxID=278961 RepID=UPI0018DCC93C|nr:hypothetical protein [Terriglobus sp. TAA 43]